MPLRYLSVALTLFFVPVLFRTLSESETAVSAAETAVFRPLKRCFHTLVPVKGTLRSMNVSIGRLQRICVCIRHHSGRTRNVIQRCWGCHVYVVMFLSPDCKA